ncbi:hypothetical protein HYH03_002112 [Edaphochlamys debaryana]|uniref:Pherophorin domain-containing protein n=1 Tax=Edaphochlamys debaryana TaxID=47281 RepID=A0A835YJP4_9CHLO|nr:hypothetical protein HYH03_002112 [Edaphochlamys debaryana]|eukprot:KAG2499820.1 hypothetical protein HYH03_002112 [Edaphochlamys debaryana]
MMMRTSRALLASAALALLAAAVLCASPASAAQETDFFGLRGSRHLLQAKKRGPSSTSSSTSKLLFPPLCNCERTARKSPFRLALDDTTSGTEPGLRRYCFRVDDIGTCDPTSKCCDGKQGVQKVEFDVVGGCKDSMRKVTVDGKQVPYEYNTNLNVLRVTGLGRTAEGADGTQICLFLSASAPCSRLNQLCTAGSGLCKYAIFNKDNDCCPCQRNAAGSRLFTTASKNVTTVNGLTRICFNVGLKDVCSQPKSKCCQFELYKMEFEVDGTCQDALAYTELNGVRKPPFFQTSPFPAIKVTNIDKALSAVEDTEVCLYLRPQCNSLKKLCAFHDGTCTVGLFNKPGTGPLNCCPLSSVSL